MAINMLILTTMYIMFFVFFFNSEIKDIVLSEHKSLLLYY